MLSLYGDAVCTSEERGSTWSTVLTVFKVSSAGERNFSASILFRRSSSNVYILLGTCWRASGVRQGLLSRYNITRVIGLTFIFVQMLELSTAEICWKHSPGYHRQTPSASLALSTLQPMQMLPFPHPFPAKATIQVREVVLAAVLHGYILKYVRLYVGM